jgi:hypothetical protein
LPIASSIAATSARTWRLKRSATTSKIVKDPAASIRAKLLAHAKQHSDDFGRVLTRYAIERLLFRLSQTDAAKRYVLKAAMLFITWPQHVLRPTGDLDLLGQGDPEPAALAELFRGPLRPSRTL